MLREADLHLRCWRASRTISPLPDLAEPATDTLRARIQDQAGDPRDRGREGTAEARPAEEQACGRSLAGQLLLEPRPSSAPACRQGGRR
ncbi:MAG: hypothetical protein ACRDOI_30735 [Trebonia sp.]